MKSEDEKAEMLALKVKEGNLKAFEKLYKMYNRLVFGIIYNVLGNHEDARDVRQEVFLSAWRAIVDCRWTPKEGATFRAWIGKLAINRAIDVYRKRVRLPDMFPLEDEVDKDAEETTVGVPVIDKSLTPDESAILEEHIEIVRRVIREIDPRYREVMMRYYFAEESVAEIAEELDMPENTVKVWLYRGRIEMKPKLIKAGIDGLD